MSFVNISFIYSLIFYLRWNPAVLSLTMHCCSLLISTSLIVLCLLLQPQSVPSLKCSIPSLPPPLLCLLPLSLPLCFPQFLSLLYPHHAPILSIFVLLCLSVPLFFSLPSISSLGLHVHFLRPRPFRHSTPCLHFPHMYSITTSPPSFLSLSSPAFFSLSSQRSFENTLDWTGSGRGKLGGHVNTIHNRGAWIIHP